MSDILEDEDTLVRIREDVQACVEDRDEVYAAVEAGIRAILKAGYRIVKADNEWGEFQGQPKPGQRSGFGIRRAGERAEAIQLILDDSDPQCPIFEAITVERSRADLIAELATMKEAAE